MPIYEYDCGKCQKSFEELVRGDNEVKCPSCGATDIARKLSICGFVTSSKSVGSTGSSCGGCSKHSCSGCSCAN